LKTYLDGKKWVRRRLLCMLQPCQEMVPLMSESLERRLKPVEQLKLRLHLVVCVWCARYLKQIKFIRRLARQRTASATLQRDASCVGLTVKARERIATALAQTPEDYHPNQAAE